MSPKFPSLKPKTVVKIFEKIGFIKIHQSGSHLILRHPETKKRVVIPIHTKDIKKGLLLAEIKKIGINKENFLSYL
jgi:predicted RNA binding protein YcfA (HicA-like mRNA interferase family)